jgi:hypothetical protein
VQESRGRPSVRVARTAPGPVPAAAVSGLAVSVSVVTAGLAGAKPPVVAAAAVVLPAAAAGQAAAGSVRSHPALPPAVLAAAVMEPGAWLRMRPGGRAQAAAPALPVFPGRVTEEVRPRPEAVAAGRLDGPAPVVTEALPPAWQARQGFPPVSGSAQSAGRPLAARTPSTRMREAPVRVSICAASSEPVRAPAAAHGAGRRGQPATRCDDACAVRRAAFSGG